MTEETQQNTDSPCAQCPSSVEGECGIGKTSDSCGTSQEQIDAQVLRERMERIEHKVLVLSGKGGVGKSTIAANLAVSLCIAGKRVGLMDVDIHGPSIPRLLKMDDSRVVMNDNTLIPPTVMQNDDGGFLKMMSIGLLIPDSDDALIWRGPMKMGVIKQFLKDVEWGELDYLIVDNPPGTGDEPLSVCQLIPDADGAVIVTTPQQLAVADVRKSINFCRKLKLPILGVIENMSGLRCPNCSEIVDVFKSGGGEELAHDLGIRFLGKIPLDPELVVASDLGEAYLQNDADSPTAKAFAKVVEALMETDAQMTAIDPLRT